MIYRIYIEEPDNEATVDFLTSGEMRACSVRLTNLAGELRIQVTACDDRCSILLDEVLEIPPEDSDDEEADEDDEDDEE
jgi:hypothetical protein